MHPFSLFVLVSVILFSLAIWEAIKFLFGLYRENVALKKQLAERREVISEDILNTYAMRLDSAYQLRRLALHEHMRAEYTANPAMVADTIEKFIKESRKAK